MTGEEKYLAYHAAHLKEHPPEGTIEGLRTVLAMIRQYAIPEMSANEQGQVPFFRAVFDSVVAEIEASIRRQETDAETAAANWKAIQAIPAICRGEEVACPLHVSHPISELRRELAAVKLDVVEWVQLAKYHRDWFAKNHADGKNAGPCPTDAAIEASEKLLGREIGYPTAI